LLLYSYFMAGQKPQRSTVDTPFQHGSYRRFRTLCTALILWQPYWVSTSDAHLLCQGALFPASKADSWDCCTENSGLAPFENSSSTTQLGSQFPTKILRVTLERVVGRVPITTCQGRTQGLQATLPELEAMSHARK
jgi:hypothetical protein